MSKLVNEDGATMIEKDGVLIRKKDKYRRDKPWDDNPNLDKFVEPDFKPEDNPNGVLEESSFSVLFP
jgi:ribosomal RNA assembly protein